MIEFNFKGQTVVVTGGTRGIGKSITRAFLEAGAYVYATYAGNHESAKKFRQEVGELEDNLNTVCFDVRDKRAVENFFLELTKFRDSIDVVINSAGIRNDSVLAMMKEEQWDNVLDINLKGSYLISQQAVLNMMRKRYGRIIMLTSPGARFGFAGQANYSASKAGQIAMMRSLSKEVATRGITVNCVSPGFIETELIQDLPDNLKDEYKKMVPMRRFGKPSEVANTVLFLSSKEASYIQGSVIEISGGL